MSTRKDTLEVPPYPDRVFYELGVMLDKDDFLDEQTYHRGRLARALSFLHGSGTAAGLFVRVSDPEEGGDASPPNVGNERVQVEAGIAVDGIGRLIEMTTKHCTPLKRWLDAQSVGASPTATAEERAQFSRLREAFHPTIESGAMIVDVLIRFAACDRGKTPGFTTGPFDSLDAVQPSRIRDAFELHLVPRTEDPLPTPQNPWPDLSNVKKQDRSTRLHEAVFAAWEASVPSNPPSDPMVPLWLDATGDKHWLFLARLTIPAVAPKNDDALPTRRTDRRVVVDNEIRPFVYTTGAIARLVGL